MSELAMELAATAAPVTRDPVVIGGGVLATLAERVLRLMFEGVSGGFRMWV